MQKQITISAPGKLMLFGEHAVVYGKPCIVTSVNQKLSVKISQLDKSLFELNAPDVGVENYSKELKDLGKSKIPKGAKFIEIATKNFLDYAKPNLVIARPRSFTERGEAISFKSGIAASSVKGRTPRNDKILGIKFETHIQFKSTFGFGSSSAAAVCTIKALSEIFKIKLTEKEIFKLAYKTVLDIQGIGSGVDLAAAIYGGTLYFVTGGKTIQPLATGHLPLIVGYTGVKADTATILRAVKAKFENYPKQLKNVYDGIELIVEQAKIALLQKDFETVGNLMNLNQGYLEVLGVSSEKLSAMIYAARNAGAYGAKLSGAGGGDCMIALAPPSKRKAVEKAIENVGGQILKVKVNATGVSWEDKRLVT